MFWIVKIFSRPTNITENFGEPSSVTEFRVGIKLSWWLFVEVFIQMFNGKYASENAKCTICPLPWILARSTVRQNFLWYLLARGKNSFIQNMVNFYWCIPCTKLYVEGNLNHALGLHVEQKLTRKHIFLLPNISIFNES